MRSQTIASAFLLTLVCISSSAQVLPRLHGETLSNKQIVLPDDAHGKIAFLICGFSKKGGQATDAWKQRLQKDFASDQRFAIYPIAVLEDAPRLVRGIIKSSIRRSTPPAEQDRFVVIVQGEADLKHFLGFSAPDDAYVLLLDGDGEVRWRGHGTFQDETYRPLQEAARKLAEK